MENYSSFKNKANLKLFTIFLLRKKTALSGFARSAPLHSVHNFSTLKISSDFCKVTFVGLTRITPF